MSDDEEIFVQVVDQTPEAIAVVQPSHGVFDDQKGFFFAHQLSKLMPALEPIREGRRKIPVGGSIGNGLPSGYTPDW
jgi:hypothetical protein